MKIERGSINEINRLHDEIVEGGKIFLAKATYLGGLLTEQKYKLGHGKWLPWVEQNLLFSPRTASSYMRLFANRERLKSENVSDLAGAYALLTEPKSTPPELSDEEEWGDEPPEWYTRWIKGIYATLFGIPDYSIESIATLSYAQLLDGWDRVKKWHADITFAIARDFAKLGLSDHIGELFLYQQEAEEKITRIQDWLKAAWARSEPRIT